jgi:hypothetical protein
LARNVTGIREKVTGVGVALCAMVLLTAGCSTSVSGISAEVVQHVPTGHQRRDLPASQPAMASSAAMG